MIKAEITATIEVTGEEATSFNLILNTELPFLPIPHKRMTFHLGTTNEVSIESVVWCTQSQILAVGLGYIECESLGDLEYSLGILLSQGWKIDQPSLDSKARGLLNQFDIHRN